MQKNYINGEWIETAEGRNNVNPSDITDIVGVYAHGDAAQANAAVTAAKAAFPLWARSTPQQRFDVLDFVGSEILARKQELGRLLAREEGKTLPEAIGEVTRAGHIFKFFAGEALRIPGDFLKSVRPGVDIDVIRQPIGVIGLITPWNFPIAIPSWKTAPALAFGNTVVLKPAELAPGCSWAIAEIISRSGLPPGVFNLVNGPGSKIGEALVIHPDIGGISFTGSQQVGGRIALHCAKQLKKLQLEMGGKNPLVVLDDADLDVAVTAAINGSFYSTGQRCTASSRLIATEGIHDRFVQRMVERMAKLKVDDALAEGTDIGPAVDESQLEKDLSYIGLGVKEGGTIAFGGEWLKRAKEGFYIAPTLITGTTNTMRINQEEVFGPIAGVIRVKNYDEALTVANDTPFGLSSGICTASLKYASHFKENAQAGMVMVNLPTAGVDYHVPFGGRKGSSFGTREQGQYAVEFYTTVKTCYVAP
jgi:alpha-ketoglutaric semialdehyde dehydrogenase